MIRSSPPFGMPPFVVPADTSPEFFVKLQKILLNMDKTLEGKKILKSIGFNRFVKTDDADYDSVRKLLESWQNDIHDNKK